MEKVMSYESILLVEPGDEILVLKKEVICDSSLTDDIKYYNNEEYYLAKVVRKIKNNFFINDGYLPKGIYDVLSDEIIVSIENQFIGSTDVKVSFQNILKYNRTEYIYNEYIVKIEEFNNTLDNLVIDEDTEYEILIAETANCSLKEWVLRHNLLYNYFQLKEYDIGQNITINISENYTITLPIKNIENIKHIQDCLYLDLDVSNLENVNGLFEIIVNEIESRDNSSDFYYSTINSHFPILNELIYNIENKVLKIKLGSPYILENRKYKLKIKDIGLNFKSFSDFLRYIQNEIIPNIKQKIEIGICVFTFDKINFERVSDNKLIMEIKYRNENNYYTLKNIVIQIDLEQDVLSIDAVKSLLEDDEVLRKVLN